MQKELQITKNKTPIEIALGIGEDGMTTVGKLYDFLGMSRKNYARWYKANIIDNKFAEENIDYFPFVTNEECGGQASNDSKITARFAKKLSMLQKNERGEQAREYFTSVEDYAVNVSTRLKEMTDNPMKLLEIHYEALKQNQSEIAEVKSSIGEVKEEFEKFRQELPLFGVDEDKITTAVHKMGVKVLGGKDSNAYKDKSIHGKVFADIYRELKRQFGISGTYKQLKRNQCDTAVAIINSYQPPLVLAERIKDCNAQMSVEVA